MTYKLFLLVSCTFLFICSCNKSEPELTFPYNFECKIDGRNYSVDYDPGFVSLSDVHTNYRKDTKKLTVETFHFLCGNFHIEIEGFEKDGLPKDKAIYALLQTEELSGPTKYDYVIDHNRPANFRVIEFDTLDNTAKGTFAFSLKPINLQSNLRPIDITGGKFRFEFD